MISYKDVNLPVPVTQHLIVTIIHRLTMRKLTALADHLVPDSDCSAKSLLSTHTPSSTRRASLLILQRRRWSFEVSQTFWHREPLTSIGLEALNSEYVPSSGHRLAYIIQPVSRQPAVHCSRLAYCWLHCNTVLRLNRKTAETAALMSAGWWASQTETFQSFL